MLARYFHNRSYVDESYFQTILANSPGLKLNNNNWRYVEWNPTGSHPRTLGVKDLPKILSSGAHFARKFDLDTDASVFDELDRFVEAKALRETLEI